MGKSMALLGVSFVVASSAATASAESGEYAFEVPLAAVSPVGDFPIHVETPSFLVDGTVHVTLDASGRLTAAADFPGRHIDLAGRFTAARGRESVSLRSAGRGGARFTGTLSGTTFAGSFVDGGSLTKGAGRFSIDVSSAVPLTVSVALSVHGGFGATRRGTGSAAAAGVIEDIVADVRGGARTQMHARGTGFQWSCGGVLAPDALVVRSWRCRAFGATASGTDMVTTFDAVPDVALLIANGDAHESADGGAPADLSHDAGPFLAHLLAVRGLEVTTSVFADTDETAPDAGYTGMVAKLAAVRDAGVTGRTFPTRVVVVGFGHGSVRAHAAIRDVPDAPVAVQIDLDGTANGWAAQGHDTAAIGGDPVGAVAVLTVPYDLNDVVFPNVAESLDVHSASLTPDSLTGGGPQVPYDERTHRRLDGGVDGVFRLDTTTTHDELHDVFGTTLPRVGRWLADRIAPAKKAK